MNYKSEKHLFILPAIHGIYKNLEFIATLGISLFVIIHSNLHFQNYSINYLEILANLHPLRCKQF